MTAKIESEEKQKPNCDSLSYKPMSYLSIKEIENTKYIPGYIFSPFSPNRFKKYDEDKFGTKILSYSKETPLENDTQENPLLSLYKNKGKV